MPLLNHTIITVYCLQYTYYRALLRRYHTGSDCSVQFNLTTFISCPYSYLLFSLLRYPLWFFIIHKGHIFAKSNFIIIYNCLLVYYIIYRVHLTLQLILYNDILPFSSAFLLPYLVNPHEKGSPFPDCLPYIPLSYILLSS